MTVDAPVDVATTPLPLDAERAKWVDAALDLLDEEAIRQLNLDVVNLHSPMGHERPLAEWLVERMGAMGMASRVQPIDELSANAVGSYGPGRDGPTLMLYAPIDTHLAADPDVDLPWAGASLRPDMLPQGYVDDVGNVIGLGASNPKSIVTAQLSAIDAVMRAGVPLTGQVVGAFCGGGMPYHAPEGSPRQGIGMGSGVFNLLQQGQSADFAIICKPGYQVIWEEPGLAWFRITTRGVLSYAGFSHAMPGYKSAIADLAVVATELEEWLPRYAEANASGLIRPQGALGALRAGSPSRTAIPPGAAELYVDLRITPRSSPTDAHRQLEAELDRIRARHPGIVVDCEMVAAYASASTDPNNWIVQTTSRGWEYVEQQPHPKRNPMSGQTDASILRNLGIPTARVGVPSPIPGYPPEWEPGLGGMGVSHIPDVRRVAAILVYAIVDTCTRPLADVGL